MSLFRKIFGFVVIAVALFATTHILHALQGVGNIDESFAIERVTVSKDGRLYAWDRRGNTLSGFPVDLTGSQTVFRFRPRLVDVNRDTHQEIITVVERGDSSHQLRVYKGDGSEIESWRFSLPIGSRNLLATPVIADINEDNRFEILFSHSGGDVLVYNRSFEEMEFEDLDVGGTPYVAVADHNNDGKPNLFAASGSHIYIWDRDGNRSEFYSLPGDEEIIGEMAVIDYNGDSFEDFVLTTARRIVFVSGQGSLLNAITVGSGHRMTGGPVTGDVDLDGEVDIIVPTEQKRLLAYHLNGTPVNNWDRFLSHRMDIKPAVGRVADDQYTGIFESSVGFDNITVYRSGSDRFARLVLGENVHEFDTWLPLPLVEGPFISNVIVHPQLITPNGDGVNDTAQVSYTLSQSAEVTLQVLDSRGRLLYQQVTNASRNSGSNNESWNAVNNKGTLTPNDDEPLDKGMYILRIIARNDEGIMTAYDTFGVVFGVRAQVEFPEDTNREDRVYPLISGMVNISGMATDPNIGEASDNFDFNSYKLYYQPGVWEVTEAMAAEVGNDGSRWVPITVPIRHQSPTNINNEPNDSLYPESNVSVRPVQHAILGTWDTTDVTETPNGNYTILLKVLDSAGSRPGRFNYDSVVVTISNFDPDDPDAPEPGDDEPGAGSGPTLSGISANPVTLTLSDPRTTIRYSLTNREDGSSDVNITIYELSDGSPGSTVYTQNFPHLSDGNYSANWNGTDTLGRRVDNGSYGVLISAASVDGLGYAENSSLNITVDMETEENDELQLLEFRVSPDQLDPFNFDSEGLLPVDLLPLVHYVLNKPASVSLSIYDGSPESGGVLKKELLQDYIGSQDPPNLTWDGTDSNGLVLPVNHDYYFQITAVGLEFGRDEMLISPSVVVRLRRETPSGALLADLDRVIGDDVMNSGILVDDAELIPLEGDPHFEWRAYGSTGYVKTPFEYTMGVYGTDNLGEYETDTRSTSEAVYCRTPCDVDPSVCPAGSGNTYCDAFSDGTMAFPAGWTVSRITATPNLTPWAGFFEPTCMPPGPCPAIGIREEMCDAASYFSVRARVGVGGGRSWREPSSPWFNGCGSYTYNPPSEINSVKVRLMLSVIDQYPPPDSPFYYLFKAEMRFTVEAYRDTRWSQAWNHSITNSGCGSSPSQGGDCPNHYVQNYNGPLGSGLAGVNSTQIHYYTLSTRANVNGSWRSSDVSGGRHYLPGIEAWMGDDGGPHTSPSGYSSNRFVANGTAGRNWHTGRDSALSSTGGWLLGNSENHFTRDNFHLESSSVVIRDSYPFSDSLPDLYTYSNLVHINSWDIELKYPNGDTVEAFEVVGPTVFANGTLNIEGDGLSDVNTNYNDYFSFKLKPQGVPRRFLEIRGSAGDGYELRFYDANRGEWRSIPSASDSMVVDGTLARWDVTYLNGEDFTLLLRTEDGGDVNEDIMNISIGAPVEHGELVTVYTPFRRGSLTFDPDTLPVDDPEDLVTISVVEPDDPSVHLPTGVVPLGPVFDLQPSDITIDPDYPVEIKVVYTCEEIRDIFGGDPAEVSLYHLKDDGELEMISSLNQPDPDHCVGAPADRLFEIVGFLNHFSKYAVFKRGDPPPGIRLDSPDEEGHYAGEVAIQGTIDSDDIASWILSYYPEDDESEFEYIEEGDTSDIDTLWDTSDLNGNYIILVEATTNSGKNNQLSRKVILDNRAPESYVVWGDRIVRDGERIIVEPDEVLTLFAVDDGDGASGVASLQYRIDGGAFSEYESPISLDGLAGANHSISFFATDNLGNEEDIRTVYLTIATADELPDPDEPTSVRTSLTNSDPSYTSGGQIWISPETEISIVPTAGIEEFDRAFYRIGGGSFMLYTDSFTLAGEEDGLYEVEFYGMDIFGTIEPLNRATLMLDAVPPLSSIEPQGRAVLQGGELLIGQSTLFSVTAEDGGGFPSGLDRIEYKIGAGDWQTYSAPFRVTPAGADTINIEVRGIDRVANTETPQSLRLRFDRIDPAIELVSISPAFSPNGDGVKDTAQIRINVEDNFSEALSLTFKVNDHIIFSDQPVIPGPFMVTWNGEIDAVLQADGAYSYSLLVKDEENNESEALSGTLILDTEAPSLEVDDVDSIRFAADEGDEESEGSLDILYEIEDNIFSENLETKLDIETVEGSEIAEVEQEVSVPPTEHTISWEGTSAGGTLVSEGGYRFVLTATDPAGNTSDPIEGDFLLDRSAPITMVVFSEPKYELPDLIWLGVGATATLIVQDLGSEIEEFQYRLNGGEWISYIDPISFDEEGEYILEVKAVDILGNESEIQLVHISVDHTPPVTSLDIEGIQYDRGDFIEISGAQTFFSLTATDSGSGVNRIRFIVDSFNTLVGDDPIHLGNYGDGRHTLAYWSVDNVSNEEERREIEVDLNGAPPVSTIHIGDPKYRNEGLWYVTEETLFHIETNSNRPDIEWVRYRIDDEDFVETDGEEEAQVLTDSFSVEEEGNYQITYWSQDTFQNRELDKTLDIFVDNTAPQTELQFDQIASLSTGMRAVTPSTNLSLAATDEGSGVHSSYFAIDGGEWQTYTTPFLLRELGVGEHTIAWYSKDNVMNTEETIEETIYVLSIDLVKGTTRRTRTLTYLIECSDVNPDRPVSGYLNELINNRLRGFHQVVENQDDFVKEMRRDLYNTFIFATDGASCFFPESRATLRMMAELREKVFEGDHFISLFGSRDVQGIPWIRFAEKVLRERTDSSTLIRELSGDNYVYGSGRGIKLDVTLTGSEVDAAFRSTFEDLLREIVGLDETLNANQILATRMVVSSLDQNVDVELTESFPVTPPVEMLPGGSIVSRSVVWDFTVSAGSSSEISYLQRVPESAGDYTNVTTLRADWASGLFMTDELETTFRVENSADGLFGQVIDSLSGLRTGSGDIHDLVIEEDLKRLNSERALPLEAQGDLIRRVDVLLHVIEDLERIGELYDPVHFILSELLTTTTALTDDLLPDLDISADIIDSPIDDDRDGLSNDIEREAGTNPLDADSDDDGVVDGMELQALVDSDGDGSINALDPDSDNDGLLDGMEMGVIEPVASYEGDPVLNVAAYEGTITDSSFLSFDGDPSTTTDPTNPDTDGGGLADGDEDSNQNGIFEKELRETDPNDPDDDTHPKYFTGGEGGCSLFTGGSTQNNVIFLLILAIPIITLIQLRKMLFRLY